MRKLTWWILIVVLAIGLLLSWRFYFTIHYNFDARHPESVAAFGWTATEHHIGYSALELVLPRRTRQVRVQLPGIAPYEEPRASNIYIDTSGDRLVEFMVFSAPLTSDEVVDRMTYWAQEWTFRFNDDDVKGWQDHVKSGNLGPYSPDKGYFKLVGADVWFEVRPSFDRERPWLIMLDIYWRSPILSQ